MTWWRRRKKNGAGLLGGALAHQVDLGFLEGMREIEANATSDDTRARARRYIDSMEWWIATGQSKGREPEGEGRACDKILRAYEESQMQ